MKKAELLKDRKGIFFKLTLKDNKIRNKLRLYKGFKRIGLTTFRVPYSKEVRSFLEENEFEFNQAYKKLKQLEWDKANPIKKIPKYDKLGLKPYPYQISGVNYIERVNGLALLGDEMGLGKTVQALAWIQLNRKQLNRILIISPSSLKINWYEEFRKWVTKKYKIQILEGIKPYDITGDVVIVNYDILKDWVIELKLTNFDVAIIDEIHYLKSDSALRTKAYNEIVMKGIPKRIGLSGTPIDSDPIEIYHIVKRINKNIFPNYIKFIQRYCSAVQVDQKVKGGKFVMKEMPDGTTKRVWEPKTREVWKRGKFTKQKELHEILTKHIMIRRTHAEVDIELPDKVYSDIHVQINNEKKYRKAEDNFIEYIKEKFREAKEVDEMGFDIDEEDLNNKLDSIAKAPAFAKLNELKMLAANGKLNSVIEWLNNFLETTNEKIIVFAINKFMVKKLHDEFPNSLLLVGDTSTKQRDINVKAFKNDPKARVFIISEAGGVGLNLVAASNIVITQFPWNPGKLAQVEHRAVRIGQKAKKVFIYKFIAKNTIEERLINLLNYKQDEIEKIIDGKEPLVQKTLLKLLINSYK